MRERINKEEDLGFLVPEEHVTIKEGEWESQHSVFLTEQSCWRSRLLCKHLWTSVCSGLSWPWFLRDGTKDVNSLSQGTTATHCFKLLIILHQPMAFGFILCYLIQYHKVVSAEFPTQVFQFEVLTAAHYNTRLPEHQAGDPSPWNCIKYRWA